MVRRTRCRPVAAVGHYKLANSLYYDNANIEKLQIEVLSYDNSKPYGTKLSNDTYILVDDLTFEGTVNPLPRFTTGLPDGFEKWGSLNNILLGG